MKSSQGFLLCLLTGATLGPSIRAATADAAEHPYKVIAATNVFRLKSPPASESQKPLPAPPPPQVTLQGITTIYGYRAALFKVTISARQSAPAKAIACVLGEGQREGEIEVLQINEHAGTVRFRNHGVEQVLTLGK